MALKPNEYSSQFWLLCLSSLLFMSSFNMLIPELPNYITQLGGADKKGLIISLFAAAALISRPVSGKLSDLIGRLPIMYVGVFVCVTVGAFYPLLTGVWGFLMLRFIHGFSSGFMPTGTTAYLTDVVPPQKRGEAMGLLGISGSIGMAIGPYFGSMIAQKYGINTMFYSSSAIASLSILVLISMKETLEDKQKFKLKFLSISKDDLFEKSVLVPSVIMFFVVYAFSMILILTPDLCDHLKIENRGLFSAFFVVTSVLVRLFAGNFSDKYGRIVIMKIGTFILALSIIVLIYVDDYKTFVASALLMGFGYGLCSPAIFAWTADLAKPKKMGKAMSTLFIALELGIIFGSFIPSFIYSNNIQKMKYAFASGLIFVLMALFVILLFENRVKIKPINNLK